MELIDLNDNFITNCPSSANSDSSNSSNNTNNEDDDESHCINKRRRIDINGKYQATNSYAYKTPTKVVTCKKGKRIRALAFNKKNNEIVAIAMNASFHSFNSHRFVQNYAKKLSIQKENVCLAINSDNNIYAIGSASHVQLLIADSGKSLLAPIFIQKDIGTQTFFLFFLILIF